MSYIVNYSVRGKKRSQKVTKIESARNLVKMIKSTRGYSNVNLTTMTGRNYQKRRMTVRRKPRMYNSFF